MADALAAVLPEGAVGVERGTIDEERSALGEIPPLYPVEEALVAGASERRRREFAEARACARAALMALGAPAGAIGAERDGAPLWPAGVVGSITHKGGYRAAAVAFAAEMCGLGIDAEPDERLPDGLLATIASRAERLRVEQLLADRPDVAWDRLLFCAKEAAVKAARPLGPGVAGVRAVEVSIEAEPPRFKARLLERDEIRLEGAWARRSGVLLVAARAG
jgi:4'-phosphopantetheinyl transferase EntD